MSSLTSPLESNQSLNDGHDEFLAHHFATAKQQFDAGKLGMWLFLVTEILFFSGLFCAYAVYRRSHPEAFANADQYLDVTLGATNTAILLFSSLTMAWAVRAAQLGQQRLLLRLIVITLGCASTFLGVKAVEYAHKWETGILWGALFHPQHGHDEHGMALTVLSVPAFVLAGSGALAFVVARNEKWRVERRLALVLMFCSLLFFGGVGLGKGLPALQHELTSGLADQVAVHSDDTADHDATYTAIFFSIYYVMTGLHAIHIVAGMAVMFWLLRRAMLGHFGPDYFGPVDFVGLYWHLVDLIWIYLFPLLYLIG